MQNIALTQQQTNYANLSKTFINYENKWVLRRYYEDKCTSHVIMELEAANCRQVPDENHAALPGGGDPHSQ